MQLANLCAFFTLRWLQAPENPNPFFEALRDNRSYRSSTRCRCNSQVGNMPGGRAGYALQWSMNGRRESWYGKIRSLFIEVLVFLSRPLEDDREAIWSVPNPLRALYFPIFTGISIVIAIGVAGETKARYPDAGWITLMREGAAEFAPAGIGIAIATLAALQGVATIMAIYQYITNRFTLPVIERHLAQGREQGIEEAGNRASRRAEPRERLRLTKRGRHGTGVGWMPTPITCLSTNRRPGNSNWPPSLASLPGCSWDVGSFACSKSRSPHLYNRPVRC